MCEDVNIFQYVHPPSRGIFSIPFQIEDRNTICKTEYSTSAKLMAFYILDALEVCVGDLHFVEPLFQKIYAEVECKTEPETNKSCW